MKPRRIRSAAKPRLVRIELLTLTSEPLAELRAARQAHLNRLPHSQREFIATLNLVEAPRVAVIPARKPAKRKGAK